MKMLQTFQEKLREKKACSQDFGIMVPGDSGNSKEKESSSGFEKLREKEYLKMERLSVMVLDRKKDP